MQNNYNKVIELIYENKYALLKQLIQEERYCASCDISQTPNYI